MFKKYFESAELKKANNELIEINDLEETISKLTDDQLKAKTHELKQKIKEGATPKDIRKDAFAVAREATKRVLKKRLYDVQILGGLILDYGSVAEMKTGEGKTITSIPPVYLNALFGKGVIVSTVNEYLTERDAEEVAPVYSFLGLTIGTNLSTKNQAQKKEAYSSDVTYSVHSEIGFDYLRDNMVKTMAEKVQRPLNYALVDEVDSILIDEAKTPLIISGGETVSSAIYFQVDQFVKTLTKDDYDIDWEVKSIQLSDEGIKKGNKFFGKENIFSFQHSDLIHRIQNALRANYLMALDADYIIRDNKILIVDAFTGRVMEGRSFSDGLHQAIQAKEKVEIEAEMKTLATITYQNLFRMFSKLCGMSGTAKTEENEFIEIYNMRVHEIPTNEPIQRIDHRDLVFASGKVKNRAIIEEIIKHHKKKQPILVGTEEVSESERLSKLLKQKKIKHTVLNAKQNESEADIIAKAGEEGAITIATNMAGRGTDIKPTKAALKAGGLYVIGTNRAESRRIDNQLKGRSGRQGDVGESKFFLSLDDKLISRFSNQEKLKKVFSSYADEPIKGKGIAKALSRAQIKIEGFNFDMRKNVLQFDDVIRQQRDLIYAQRDLIIGKEDLLEIIRRMMTSVVREAIIGIDEFKLKDGTYNLEKIIAVFNRSWFFYNKKKLTIKQIKDQDREALTKTLSEFIVSSYDELRENLFENIGEEAGHFEERQIILHFFDANWQLHIDKMTKLRASSSMASYAQQNPYQVYTQRGAELFKDLLASISRAVVRALMLNRNVISVDQKQEVVDPVKVMVEKALKENKKEEPKK